MPPSQKTQKPLSRAIRRQGDANLKPRLAQPETSSLIRSPGRR